MGIAILVCGSRNETRRLAVWTALDSYRDGLQERGEDIAVVVTGAADGTDRYALQWARGRGIPFIGIPASWDTLGRAAGPVRNTFMAGLPIDVCIAFPGGNGTEDMIRKAMDHGIFVRRESIE